jgi:hypothetical protein
MSTPAAILEGSYAIGESVPNFELPSLTTTLDLDRSDGLSFGPAVYPVGETERFDWTPVVLDVYRGSVEIDVPVLVEDGANPGRRTVSRRVRYQGCTANACLPPADVSVEVHLEIAREEEE